MVNVLFFIRDFTERETEVSTFDYAHFNEEILNNKSFIVCFDETKQRSFNGFVERYTFDKFSSRFKLFEIGNISEISIIIREYNIDFFYTQTHGGNDIYEFNNKLIWQNCKTIKHCVFDTTFPESNFYISISKTLKDKNNTNLEVIPYLINLADCNDNLKKELNIPEDSIVFGRYGGYDEFNIDMAKNSIVRFLNMEESKNTYFLFMNTRSFYNHPRIIYLDKSIDVLYKVKFINSCDAMIHARSIGETIDLSVAEFSSKNKPIITTSMGDIEHLYILKEKALIYNNEEDLINIMKDIKQIIDTRENWNAYEDYTPEKVMKKFDEVIFSTFKKTNIYPITFSIPEEKILNYVHNKLKMVSTIIPNYARNYIYNNETDYYNEYRTSVFAITCIKGGWDCMRHYEIICNGCIPYFIDIEKCPTNTMYLLPKILLLKGNILYFKYKDRSVNSLSVYERDELLNHINELLNYMKKYLTTENIANYILNKTGFNNVKNILFLSGQTNPDYLRCLTLHGFKKKYGENCHDYPIISHIYKSQHINYSDLYGKGITYSNILDINLHNYDFDKTIEDDIINKKYDIVIYGSFHRGIPFYDLVSKYYKPNEIILLCGEDINGCDCNEHIKYSQLGNHVFVRELV